jgi:hypothetical protein
MEATGRDINADRVRGAANRGQWLRIAPKLVVILKMG